MAKQNNTPEPAAQATDAPKTADAASGNAAKNPGAAKAPAIAPGVMYLGPSFARKGVLFQRGQLFNNGVPPAWLDWAGSEPEFRLLLVPHAKVAARLTELNDPDSAISIAYKKAEIAARKVKPGK